MSFSTIFFLYFCLFILLLSPLLLITINIYRRIYPHNAKVIIMHIIKDTHCCICQVVCSVFINLRQHHTPSEHMFTGAFKNFRSNPLKILFYGEYID